MTIEADNERYPVVLQVVYPERCSRLLALLGAFAGQFLDALQFLALALTEKNLVLESLRRFGMLVQIVVEFLLQEIGDEKANALPLGGHRE